MQARKERQRIHVHLFVWMIVLVVAPTVSARGYMTNGFRTKESRPMTLVLLPPHAEFIKAKVVSTEEMVKECRALEDSAALGVTKRLRHKGYIIQVLTMEVLEKCPDLRELVRKVNNRYGEEWPKIIRRRKKLEHGRYNVGDDARKLCSVLDVDGILLARVQAVYFTPGRKFLVRGLPGLFSKGGSARLDASVVNGKTGTVEGYFSYVQSTTLMELTREQDELMRGTSIGCFRRYPDATKVLRALEFDSERETEEEEDKDEESIIGEFEVLLGEEEEEHPATQAEAGDTAKVEQLPEQGADVNAKTKDCAAALMLATQEGHTGTVKLLNSELLSAAKIGYTAAVKRLLKKGADVDAKGKLNWTALMFAASKGHIGTVKALINAGADVNAKTEKGTTALMFAARYGRTETVKVLIDAGADVDAETPKGTTALKFAASKGRSEIVELLKKEETNASP